MRCTQCTYENHAGATHCAGCGAALEPDNGPPAVAAHATLEPISANAPTSSFSAARPAPAADLPDDEAAALRATASRLRAHRSAPVRAPSHAGFLVRLFAFAIDDLVLTAFAAPLGAAGFAGVRVGFMYLGTPAPPDTEATLEWLIAGAWTIMAVVYFTLLHAGAGQTIGKAVVGIRVRTMDRAAVGVTRSLVRTLGYFVSSACGGLGFLLIAVSPSKRGLHDRLAGTYVHHLAPDEEEP